MPYRAKEVRPVHKKIDKNDYNIVRKDRQVSREEGLTPKERNILEITLRENHELFSALAKH